MNTKQSNKRYKTLRQFEKRFLPNYVRRDELMDVDNSEKLRDLAVAMAKKTLNSIKVDSR